MGGERVPRVPDAGIADDARRGRVKKAPGQEYRFEVGILNPVNPAPETGGTGAGTAVKQEVREKDPCLDLIQVKYAPAKHATAPRGQGIVDFTDLLHGIMVTANPLMGPVPK